MHMKEGQSGARLINIVKDSSADGLMQEDDVLLKIDGHTVLNDGRVPFRGDGKIAISYYIVTHQVGDVVELVILRKGKEMTLRVPLKQLDLYIIPVMPEFEQKPRYYERGGMVFMPVEPRYIATLGKRIPRGINQMLGVPYGKMDIDELVVISAVYDASVNKGYQGRVENMRIRAINGHEIKRFADVRPAFEADKERRFDVLTMDNWSLVVLDRKEIEKEEPSIRQRYSISEYWSGP
jgi:hypothetical protein